MGSRKLPISDVAESIVTATDIKHYIYCPKIIYFEHVMHAEPMLGSQQREGREQHEEYVRKELRRKDAIYYSPDFKGASKKLFVKLYSSKLNLSGIVDLIIRTADGEYVPVEYKNMPSDNSKPWMDHKYQLVAYAMLIDDNYNVSVRRGYINYIPEGLILDLEITETMKMYVKRVLGSIRSIIREEKLPKIRVSERKCTGGCGYKYLCA